MRQKSSTITTSILLMLFMNVHSNLPPLDSGAELEIQSKTTSLPYVIIGSSITLDCVLLVNNIRVDGVDVTWFRYDAVEVIESPYSRYSDFVKRSSLLTIKGIESYYGGTYTCKTIHDDHELSATVVLQPIPSITFSVDCEMEQNFVAKNREGAIKCKALPDSVSNLFRSYGRKHFGYTHREYARAYDSTHSPSSSTDDFTISDAQIQWLKNGDIYLPPKDRCHLNDSIGIVCNEFVEADAGNYTFIARMTSPIEQTINRTIFVEVLTLPHIHNLPTEVVAVENSTVELTCSATGYPSPTYSWQTADRQPDYISLRRFRYDRKSGKLIIRDVSRHDAGLISCLAESFVGGDLRKVKLVVTTAEGAPFKKDQKTVISPANDLLFNGSPNSNDSSTAASNLTLYYVYVIFCFLVVFLCLLMLLFFLDVGCYVTRRRGVIALLSNYLEWGKPVTGVKTRGPKWMHDGTVKMNSNSGSTIGIMEDDGLDATDANSINDSL